MAVMPSNIVEAAKATKPHLAAVNGHAPRLADHDEVAELLAYVDPDCGYDEWIKAMMAVHSATNGSGSGFGIVDQWSAKGRKYKGTRDIEGHWKSFNGSGGVGAGTLAQMAKDGGADLAEIASRYHGGHDRADIDLGARLASQIMDNRQPSKPVNRNVKPMEAELEWLGDLKPNLSANYLVKGLLDAGTASVLYGPPNSGKTFVTSDLAYHIAAGIEWRGHRVKQAGVVYLAGEGGRGIQNRLTALHSHHGGGNVPFALRRAPVNLLDPKADMRRIISMIAAIRDKQETGLIVIDTLSRAMAGGDENGPVDMTAFISNVDAIRHETSAHVLIVHHTGKDVSRGSRGHNSLLGAIDTELEVQIDDDGNRALTVTKQRDYATGQSYHFELKSVVLGVDSDGDEVTTCLVTEADKPETTSDLPAMETCKAIMKALDTAWNEGRPYSIAHQSKAAGRYAPRALSQQFGIPSPVIQKLIQGWIDNALVATETANAKEKLKGLRVLEWL